MINHNNKTKKITIKIKMDKWNKIIKKCIFYKMHKNYKLKIL
jgi:hypothetical protein